MKTFLSKIALIVGGLLAMASPAFAVDYTITASAVVPTATTVIQHGTAGAAINAGQLVYLDATGIFQLAKANAIGTAAVAGMALNNTAAANQTLSVAIGGHVTVVGLTKGVAVYLSQANAGGAAPVADVTSGNFPVIAGIATATTDILIKVVDPDVTL